MIEAIWHRGLQMLGYRRQVYQTVFSEGGPLHQALVDLAKYSGAFDADPNGITRDDLLVRHGRRQLFFRIIHHLKLSPQELETVYRPALIAAAQRLQQGQQRQGNEE